VRGDVLLIKLGYLGRDTTAMGKNEVKTRWESFVIRDNTFFNIGLRLVIGARVLGYKLSLA
jgi:hypothetical protein